MTTTSATRPTRSGPTPGRTAEKRQHLVQVDAAAARSRRRRRRRRRGPDPGGRPRAASARPPRRRVVAPRRVSRVSGALMAASHVPESQGPGPGRGRCAVVGSMKTFHTNGSEIVGAHAAEQRQRASAQATFSPRKAELGLDGPAHRSCSSGCRRTSGGGTARTRRRDRPAAPAPWRAACPGARPTARCAARSAGFSRAALSCSGTANAGDLAVVEEAAAVGVARADADEDVVDHDRLGVHVDAGDLGQRHRRTRRVGARPGAPPVARRRRPRGPGSAGSGTCESLSTSSRCSTASIRSPSTQSQNGTKRRTLTSAGATAVRAGLRRRRAERGCLQHQPALAGDPAGVAEHGAPHGRADDHPVAPAPSGRRVVRRGAARTSRGGVRRRTADRTSSASRSSRRSVGSRTDASSSACDVRVMRGEVLVLDVDVLAGLVDRLARSPRRWSARPVGDQGRGVRATAGGRAVAAAAHLHQVARRLRRHLVVSVGRGRGEGDVEQGRLARRGAGCKERRTPSGARR